MLWQEWALSGCSPSRRSREGGPRSPNCSIRWGWRGEGQRVGEAVRGVRGCGEGRKGRDPGRRPEKNRGKGKGREKPAPVPLLPSPNAEKGSKIGCAVRGRQNESSRLREERERSQGPRGELPQASARMRGRQRQPLLPQAEALASPSHVWSGFEGCVPCRGGAAWCIPTQLTSQGLGIRGLAG